PPARLELRDRDRFDAAVGVDDLDEQVVPALVLRNDEPVRRTSPGVALLALDGGRVERRPDPFFIHHDVVSPDIDLVVVPADEPRPLPSRTLEVDGGLHRREPVADPRPLVRVRNGRTAIAEIAEPVAVPIALVRIRSGRTVVASVTEGIAVGIRLGRVRSGWTVIADIPHSILIVIEP